MLADQLNVSVNGMMRTENALPTGSEMSGSLIDTALYNFDIAQQYIDETKYPVEHRLICFHHGIALLAKHRADKRKLQLARQYLLEVVNWPKNSTMEQANARAIARSAASKTALGLALKVGQPLKNSGMIVKLKKWLKRDGSHIEKLKAQAEIDTTDSNKLTKLYKCYKPAAIRLIVEAHYNLGVVEELLGNLEIAYEHYNDACCSNYKLDKKFHGLTLLANYSAFMVGVEINRTHSSKTETVKVLAMKLLRHWIRCAIRIQSDADFGDLGKIFTHKQMLKNMDCVFVEVKQWIGI